MYRLTSAKVKNYATATSIVDALQKAWEHFEEHMPAYGTDIYKGSDSVTVDFDTNSDHIPVDVVQDLCRLAGVDPREDDDDGLHWPSAPSLDQAVKGLKKFCKNESVSVNEAITQSQLQQAVDILSKKWNIPSKKLLSDPTDQQFDQIEALAKKMKSTGSHSIGDYLNEAFLGVHLEPSDAAKIAKIVKPAKMNLTGFSEWLYAQLEDEFESVDEVLDRLKATSNDEMEEYDLNRAEYQREIKKALSQALYEFESMKGEAVVGISQGASDVDEVEIKSYIDEVKAITKKNLPDFNIIVGLQRILGMTDIVVQITGSDKYASGIARNDPHFTKIVIGAEVTGSGRLTGKYQFKLLLGKFKGLKKVYVKDSMIDILKLFDLFLHKNKEKIGLVK